MGPVVNILLRTALTMEQITDLEHWLRSITSSLEGKQGNDWWPFWIKDGSTIGLASLDCQRSCAFGLAIENQSTEKEYIDKHGSIDVYVQEELQEEQKHFLHYLGYVPQQYINVYAGCNNPIDHRILGQIALLLAERYDHIIDLGALRPPLQPGRRWDIESDTIEDVEQYVRSLAFPGHIFHMYYTTARDTRWVHHLVDTQWFRSWLQHPNFHMVK